MTIVWFSWWYLYFAWCTHSIPICAFSDHSIKLIIRRLLVYQMTESPCMYVYADEPRLSKLRQVKVDTLEVRPL